MEHVATGWGPYLPTRPSSPSTRRVMLTVVLNLLSFRLLVSEAKASLVSLASPPVCTRAPRRILQAEQLDSGRAAARFPFVVLLFLFVVGARTG